MNELQIFKNPEFGTIRTIVIDGEPWFVGKDVAKALEYSNTRDVLAKHVDNEDKRDGVAIHDAIDRAQHPVLINESGLYALIFGSKLPSAKKFKRWVTHDVLPAIRRSGHYEMPGVYPPKATSIGEIVNLIRITKETMQEQGSSPGDVAKTVKGICDQFGVTLPRCFVRPEALSLQDAYDMIDFIYSRPKEKGRKKPTYDDFIDYQIKKSGE